MSEASGVTRADGFRYVDLDGTTRNAFTIEAEINRLLQAFDDEGAKSIRETLGLAGVSATGGTAGQGSVVKSLV